MGLRICLVSPFALSQPHEVNEHVMGAADALRALGHEVTVLAPSNRASHLAEGRRRLRRLASQAELPNDTVALGPAIPVAPRNRLSVPVGLRANLRLALAHGRFDVVHAHEPGLPGISHLALRESSTITVATFHDPERLGFPPGKAQRARLLGRIDALTATRESTLEAARARFPGTYRLLPRGVDTERLTPGPERRRFVVEWDGETRAPARVAIRALHDLPGHELVVLRTGGRSSRPYVPRALHARVSVQLAGGPAARAAALRGACGLVAGIDERSALALDALACGVPVVAPAARLEQPELVVAAMARLADDGAFRERESNAARRTAEAEGFDRLAAELDGMYRSLLGRRRRPAAAEPLADRPWILADLHMHTEHSHDCSVAVPDLLEHAEAIGLGAIAVTDHNVFAGAQEAVELAHGRRLTVIPGEEVKTDGAGRGDRPVPEGGDPARHVDGGHDCRDPRAGRSRLPPSSVRPAPRDPRPRDPAPSPAGDRRARGLQRAAAVRELQRRGAALRPQVQPRSPERAPTLTSCRASGRDASGMRAFQAPEELLLSLRTAEVVRRPKSLLYLQGLKWLAQARERRVRAAAR